jgi:hypothetical protein
MPSVASPRVAGRAAPRRPAARRTGARSAAATPLPAAVARVRWEQLGRLAMLAVMVALAYLYLSAGVRMFSTWRQARHDQSAVGVMEAEHRRLTGQHDLLSDPETVEGEARRMGMARNGERQYVLSGLPGD